MAKNIQLGTGLPLFEPRSRHAILLNNYDIFDEYSQANMYCRGNRRVYELEAVLTGEFQKGPEQFEPTLSEFLLPAWEHELGLHQKYRPGIKYDSTSRVLPQTDMRGELDRNLERISRVSSDDTLTFMYLTSHGEIGSFVINNGEEMGYQDLLDKLDGVKGKKVIVALACYSGSLVDVWKERKTKDDYVILTSTTNREKGINWGENQIHDKVVKNLIARQRVSDLRIPAVIQPVPDDQHQPQIVGSYDVAL